MLKLLCKCFIEYVKRIFETLPEYVKTGFFSNNSCQVEMAQHETKVS